jgi:aminopeptidase
LSLPDPDLLERYSRLVVEFGANVQPGQVVVVGCEPGKEAVARAIVRRCYRRGARYVDLVVWDPWVKRIRLEEAAEDTLDYVPPWYGERLRALAAMRGARISLTGPVEPDLLAGIDPARAGRDQLPFIREASEVVSDRTTNWTGAPCPTPGWARALFPDLAPAEALARLWRDVAHVMRLDEPDPVAAWRARLDTISRAGARLTGCCFDAIHLEGPGTDLVVGLLPSSRWLCAGSFATVDGIEHVPNLPSEEVFTAPDPHRADGVVRSTKPLNLGGALVEDFSVRFEAGRVVAVEGVRGADALLARTRLDGGAARLGEIALVDGESRIGRLGRIFGDTLIDENAASHLAIGSSFAFAVDEADARRINTSATHVDFMVGSSEVDVTGITAAGERIPVLRGGAWQV